MAEGGRTSRRGSRCDGAATVLFVDDRNWGCFFQLEAGLRKAGFRTVRITTAPLRRAEAAFCFDRTIRISCPSALQHLPDLLEGERIVDVQAVESLAVPTFCALADLAGPEWRSDWIRRRVAVDKVVVSRILRNAGFLTPETVPASIASAEHVVDVLGLPVVHKPRIGSGGSGVSVVHTMEDLREVMTNGTAGTESFFERFVSGRHLQFSGVIANGRASLSVTYETLSRRCEMGPASAIRCLEDASLEETGQRVARTLGIAGMINVNVIRDAEGRDWVHDVNPRVWGSCAAFRSLDLDFHHAYVQWLRGTAPRINPPWERPEAELSVFPAAIEGSKKSKALSLGLAPFVRGVWPYLGWFGPRYATYEAVRHLRRVLSEMAGEPARGLDGPSLTAPRANPTGSPPRATAGLPEGRHDLEERASEHRARAGVAAEAG
jgi:hypothetical protein